MLSVSLRDIKISLYDLGGICRVVSLIFLVPLALTLYYALVSGGLSVNSLLAFVAPAVILYLLFVIFSRVDIEDSPSKTKHAMITTSLAWLIIALVGSLPFIISGTLAPLDAFFESMSGWTTTGMTMIEQPELVARDILFYRAMTQWVGGIGIIVLVLVVLMRKGTVARDYYSSEVGEQKIRPRIKSTIKETWKIYSIYTLACISLLYLAGMPFFDAIVQSFSALSTGGFTTHASSIAYYNSPLIEFILIVFMIIGAVGFLIHFRLFNGQIKALFKNIEFRYMMGLLAISTVIIMASFWMNFHGTVVNASRVSLFQAVAAMTCTGFSTIDLGNWPDLPIAILAMLMYIGGMYGSTAGGIKILRFILILSVVKYNLKKLILPKSAVVNIKLGGKPMEGEEVFFVLGLSFAYMFVAIVGTFAMMFLGYSGMQSLFLTLSAMGNVGLVNVSSASWFMMNSLGKLALIALMWIGRLEIFPVLTIFSSIIFRKKKG
ncbi:MAG: TrkH family potassium uptake protein [Candidatus Altiarchaeota archaeon]|nr:TrkH family potassium uptake protein [Candidatus Altiarchaeota archaeon]MBU4437039.1 TrkH family potassium uptake protein [Candidatus Altiarchaeota archaeon]